MNKSPTHSTRPADASPRANSTHAQASSRPTRAHPGRRTALLLSILPLTWGQAAWAEQPASASPSAQESTRLRLDSTFMGVRNPIPEDQATYIAADKMYGNTREETFLEGNVEVRRNKLKLTSDIISYSPITDRATAKGNVTIEQEGMLLKAPEGSVKLGTREASLKSPTFELKDIKGKGRADRLSFDGISTLTLENPNYTVCEVPNPGSADQGDWYVTAETLEIDQGAEVGRARNAKVVFQDVPIIASPYFSFPTTDRRKSGFLPPSIGTVSNSGLEVTTPYYLNIAPDKDLTIYPKVISGRGFQIGNDLRLLGPNSRAELKYDVLPGDNKTNTDRYATSFTQAFQKNAYYAGVNYNAVSDDNYFVDFSRTQAVASQRVLLQEAFLGARDEQWNVNMRVVSHQTLQLANDIIAEPYNRLPEISMDYYPAKFGAGFVSASTVVTEFANPLNQTTRVEGTRGVARAKFFAPYVKPSFSITPAVSVQATSYNLTNQVAGQSASPSSVIPTSSLDGVIYFDRETSLFGLPVNQTLEPRIFYLYTPYRFQDDQPNFDTSLTDQSLTRIFAENRYAGNDRVGDANQVTLAVTSRFSNRKTGEELFSLTGGQRLNLSKTRVVLAGFESPVSSDSDLFANARGRINSRMFIDATSQFKADTGRHEKGNVSLNYVVSPLKRLNFGYRYTRAQIDQFDVSGQWPLSNRWSAVGRVNYSVLDSRMIEGVAGLEYAEGCWALRVVGQRFATAPTLQTTSLFVQLELTGLGRLGSNPLDLLSRKVPGYTPFNSSSIGSQ